MASRKRKPHPYDKVWIGGHCLDRLTYNALKAADRRFYAQYKFHLVIAQGSYNAGGVSASAGTHDGGGVIDISAASLTPAERDFALKCLKRVGFAAWLREPPTFPWHIHACLFGNTKMAQGARDQLSDFDRGLNALANHDTDNRPWRPVTKRRWSWVLNRPVVRL